MELQMMDYHEPGRTATLEPVRGKDCHYGYWCQYPATYALRFSGGNKRRSVQYWCSHCLPFWARKQIA